jgi:hypothetical protein
MNKSEFDQQFNTVYQGFYLISSDTENITFAKWVFPPVYKKSQTGGILYWQIGFDSITRELVTLHGYYTTSTGSYGKLQIDRLIVSENLSGRGIITQGKLELAKKYTDKIKNGYNVSIENIDTFEIPNPQLANHYPLKGQPGKNPLNDKHFKRGIDIEAKLDGIRCRIYLHNGEVKMVSRNNNEFKWLDKIRQEAKVLLDKLPHGMILDCELYNLNWPFEELISIITTEKVKHPKNDEVQCYIFDIVLLETILEERTKTLKDAYLAIKGSGFIFNNLFVLSHIITHDREDIQKYHDMFVSQGFEGLILRRLCGINCDTLSAKERKETYYLPGRNNNLLKVKAFFDAEGTIVNGVSGEGKEKDLVIWEIRDNSGHLFHVRPRGSYDSRRYQYEHRNEYIGKRYTYRYFELTMDGIPRFPVGISVRENF